MVPYMGALLNSVPDPSPPAERSSPDPALLPDRCSDCFYILHNFHWETKMASCDSDNSTHVLFSVLG